ncbi:hypothetical protein CLM84_23260, partial [Streptomyces albidoflavus]
MAAPDRPRRRRGTPARHPHRHRRRRPRPLARRRTPRPSRGRPPAPRRRRPPGCRGGCPVGGYGYGAAAAGRRSDRRGDRAAAVRGPRPAGRPLRGGADAP